jgi:hypothetical protein
MPENSKLFTGSKKFIASKTLDTKLGRKVLLRQLGPSGSAVFDAIVTSYTSVYGMEDGQLMKKFLLKMMVKVAILVNDKKLSQAEMGNALLFNYRARVRKYTCRASSAGSLTLIE